MALEHAQRECSLCGRPTLHTRSTYDVPHVFHLLMSVVSFFLCLGFPWWILVWILHLIVNAGRGRDPFRCTTCGQAAPWQPWRPTPLAGLLVIVIVVLLIGSIIAKKQTRPVGRRVQQAPTAVAGDKTYQRVGGQGKIHFVVVPDGGNIESNCRLAINDLREPDSVIIIMFWTDRAMVPARLPMTDEQLDAQVAHYGSNPNTGHDRFLLLPAGKQQEAERRARNAAYVPLETNEQRDQREKQAEQARLAAEQQQAEQEQERQRLAAERKAKQEARADEVRRRGRPLIVDKIELENAP